MSDHFNFLQKAGSSFWKHIPTATANAGTNTDKITVLLNILFDYKMDK